jgi:Glutamine phosphoribosylpyrophosphate amidotransferase
LKNEGEFIVQGIDFQEDKWHEECGVFGIYSHRDDVALNTYWGLFALQHRGQESTGIAVTDGSSMQIKRGMGLVPEFSRTEWVSFVVTSPSVMFVILLLVRACLSTFSR